MILVGFYFFSTIVFSYWDELQIRCYFYSSVLLVCYFIFYYFKIKEFKWDINKYLILYYSLFLFCVISFLAGPKFDNDIQLITFFSKVVLIVFIISNLVKDQRTFMFTLLMISLSSLFLFYFNYEYILIAGKEGQRLYGTFDQPNELATILIVIIWATLCIFFALKSKWRYLLLINFALSFYMVLLTGSRKGFFALILLPFLVFYFHGRIVLRKMSRFNKFFCYSLFLFTIFAVICGIAISPQHKRIKKMVVRLNSNSTTWGRPLHYRSTYRMFMESPVFGKGFNQFRHIAHKYGSPAKKTYSHSTFLELLANTGIVGLFLYLGAVFYIFYGITKSLNLNLSDRDLVVLRFGQILIILMLFCNLFAGMYAHTVFWPLLAAYVGYFRSFEIGKKIEL